MSFGCGCVQKNACIYAKEKKIGDENNPVYFCPFL